MVLSALPESARWPSAEKVTLQIQSRCPASLSFEASSFNASCFCLPLSHGKVNFPSLIKERVPFSVPLSHKRKVPSAPPERTGRPSGDGTTPVTAHAPPL